MLFEKATVLEIAELQHFGLGGGIFFQTFVLRHFSIVQKDQMPERQLAVQVRSGFESLRTSESNELRSELTWPGQLLGSIEAAKRDCGSLN